MPKSKPLRLPWWAVLGWMICCALICVLLNHVGRFDLARPILYSFGMIVVVIAMRWRMRSRVWFWITVSIIVSLHIWLILFCSWNTNWVPAVVIIPVGIADLFTMLAILAVVEKFADRPRASGKPASRS